MAARRAVGELGGNPMPEQLPSGELTWQWKMAIEIVDFPMKMVIFHSKMLVHQRVPSGKR